LHRFLNDVINTGAGSVAAILLSGKKRIEERRQPVSDRSYYIHMAVIGPGLL
jgi:hypothetical protein